MTQLIDQFLKVHQKSTGVGSVVNISTEIDQEVVLIYRQCRIEMERRLKGKIFDADRQKKFFNKILSARLSQLLTETDLLNTVRYDTLTHAIKNWCPWQEVEQRTCLYVKSMLLKLLPAVQKNQQLDLLCLRYQRHLKTEIEQQAQEHHHQAYFVCSNSKTALFGAPPLANRAQIKLVRDQRSPIEKMASESNRYIENPNTELHGALQKYQVISQLRDALATPIQSASGQIKNFERLFTAQRQVIEKDRDSYGTKFVKGIVTVLSLGIAWLLGVWDVEGETTTENIKNVLDRPLPIPHST